MNIHELKKTAEAATSGPWEVVKNPHPTFGGVQLYWIDSEAGNLAENICEEEATFIALANPDAILKLIAVYEAAKESESSWKNPKLVSALREVEK
jgi:hypothetical protein